MSKYDTSRFHGIFVALNTPYDKNGNVSPERIRNIARKYAALGVTGMYACGSTGEGVLLDVAERKLVTETLVDEIGDQMTVIVHVGAPATKHSAELAEHAWRCGAHAVSAVPCIYYRPSEDTIEAHWKSIMDAADIPFIIYNIPQLTGYDLSMKLFRKMLTYDRVSGIKNTSMNAYQTEQLKTIGGKDFIVFNGPDEQYLAGRIMGADAGIGGTYGTMPEIFLKIEDCIVKKQFDAAQLWQIRANELITELLSYPSLYGACKTIIRERFTDIGEPRAPFFSVPMDYPGLRDTYEKMEHYISMID
ncbi:MAG: dihydrodipicolinate synthase family protein [Clostridia bacterium]